MVMFGQLVLHWISVDVITTNLLAFPFSFTFGRLPALSHWLVSNLSSVLVVFPLSPRFKYDIWKVVRQSDFSTAETFSMLSENTGTSGAHEVLPGPLPPREDGVLACLPVHDDDDGGAGPLPGVTSHAPCLGLDRFDSSNIFLS